MQLANAWPVYAVQTLSEGHPWLKCGIATAVTQDCSVRLLAGFHLIGKLEILDDTKR